MNIIHEDCEIGLVGQCASYKTFLNYAQIFLVADRISGSW